MGWMQSGSANQRERRCEATQARLESRKLVLSSRHMDPRWMG